MDLMEELGGQLPTEGTQFRTKSSLEDTGGFFVKEEYVADRQTDLMVTYFGWVPGAGGDVWWMKHPDGTIQAYCYDELEMISD